MGADWNSELVDAGLMEINSSREEASIFIRDLINAYHKLDNSTDYYDVLMGDWVEHFLHAVYAAFTDMLLPLGQSYQGRLPLQEFILKSYGNYNKGLNFQINLHQNVKSILTGCFDIENKDYLNRHIIFKNLNDESRLFKCARLMLAKNPKVIFSSPRFYCSHKEFFSKLILWRRWASIDNFCFPININITINSKWRKKKAMEQCGGSKFKEILATLLPIYIPSIFLEGLQNFKNICLENTRGMRPEILYGTTSLHSNLAFKLLAAEWRERGTKLYYHQHGGGYGIDKQHTLENYETRVSDRFFTWGWVDQDKKNTTPLSLPWPCIKLRNDNKNNNILLNCADYQKIFIRMHYQPMLGSIEKMHSQTFSFLHELSEDVPLTIRPYHFDYKWEFTSRMKKIKPDSNIDLSKKKPIQRYMSYSLVVHNSLGTGYLESMALNIPTICIYEPSAYKFRDSAASYLSALQSAGMIYTSGESAAGFINKNISLIDDWWLSSKVQDARARFVEVYASFSPEWASSWESVFEGAI